MRSSTRLVAVLSLKTIIRWTRSASGRRSPAENSLPRTPEPETLSASWSVERSVHLTLPSSTASNVAARIASLMVLAVRTLSSARRAKVLPESRFLAKMLTEPENPATADWILSANASARASVIIKKVSRRYRMRTILPFVLALAIPAVSMAQPGVPPRIDFLEKRVADGATNVQERITLMNLYLAARNVEKRREQVLWLAGNHPEIPNFRNPPFDLGPSGNLPDPAGFEQAAEIWRSHAAKADAAPPVVVNAAFFFRFADRDFARSILRKLAAAHPGEPNIAKMRGTFDVLEMAGLVEGAGAFPVRSDERLRDSPAAAQARREIESSSDANLICGAAEFLSRQAFVFNSPFNDKPPLGADDPLDLAEKWLLRAAQIDPENQAVQRALGQVYASQGNQAQDPKWKVELLRKADSLIENWGGLGQLAMAELDAGDDAAATATAQRILDRKPPQ